MKLYFLDVNEKVNIDKLKGYEGVYICASQGRQENPLFDNIYEALTDSGLKIGFYHKLEVPSFKKNWTLEACKEGRAFGSAIHGSAYDLDLCVDFKDGFFDCAGDENYLPTIFYNAINGFTQKLDLYLDNPVRESDKLIIRANKRQLEYIKQRKANCKYQLMIK